MSCFLVGDKLFFVLNTSTINFVKVHCLHLQFNCSKTEVKWNIATFLKQLTLINASAFNILAPTWNAAQDKKKRLPSRWTLLLSKRKSNTRPRTTGDTGPTPIVCCPTHGHFLWDSKFFACKSHFQSLFSHFLSLFWSYLGHFDLYSLPKFSHRWCCIIYQSPVKLIPTSIELYTWLCCKGRHAL